MHYWLALYCTFIKSHTTFRLILINFVLISCSLLPIQMVWNESVVSAFWTFLPFGNLISQVYVCCNMKYMYSRKCFGFRLMKFQGNWRRICAWVQCTMREYFRFIVDQLIFNWNPKHWTPSVCRQRNNPSFNWYIRRMSIYSIWTQTNRLAMHAGAKKRTKTQKKSGALSYQTGNCQYIRLDEDKCIYLIVNINQP